MNVRKLLTASATLAVLGFASPYAAAGANDGITCPNGYESSFSNGVFKCSKQRTEHAMTICPVAFPNYKIRGSRDICTNVSSVNVPYVGEITLDAKKMAYPVPAAVGGTWTLQVNGDNGDRDRFQRTVTDYAYPQGGPVYVGLPQNGVKCPSGYTGVHNASANRLTCHDDVAKQSACLGVYGLDVNNGTDRCIFLADSQPTVPAGELSNAGWTLHVDGSTGDRDKWTKRRYEFATSLF